MAGKKLEIKMKGPKDWELHLFYLDVICYEHSIAGSGLVRTLFMEWFEYFRKFRSNIK